MAREKLAPEEAERRNKECRRRYYETHKAQIAEKQRMKRAGNPEYQKSRREAYHKSINKLVEAGLYTPLKRGRKRLYTHEEAAEVAKKQRYESNVRRRERLRAGLSMLAEVENSEAVAAQPLALDP
jgi:predicted transcriptional regulator